MAECYVNSHLHLFICTHIKLSQAKSKNFPKYIFFWQTFFKVLTCALVVTSAFAEKSASCALEGGVGGRSRKAGRRGKWGIYSSEILNLL